MRFADLYKSVLVASIMLAGMVAAAGIATADEYPIVFRTADELRSLGLANSYADQVKPFKNKCYYYGDGGYGLSFSDAFYKRFKARGFSIQAVCLGLVSITLRDPETGRRLPTYIVIGKDAMKYGLDSEYAEYITQELPLDLPNCYKNANPYSDCTFRYGRISGKKLTDKQTQIYRRLGAAIDKAAHQLVIAQKRGTLAGDDVLSTKRDALTDRGYRQANGYYLPSMLTSPKVDEFLLRYSSASVWALSDIFPKGYGYAVDADGAAGPSVDPSALKAALNGLAKPRVDLKELQAALEASATKAE